MEIWHLQCALVLKRVLGDMKRVYGLAIGRGHRPKTSGVIARSTSTTIDAIRHVSNGVRASSILRSLDFLDSGRCSSLSECNVRSKRGKGANMNIDSGTESEAHDEYRHRSTNDANTYAMPYPIHAPKRF